MAKQREGLSISRAVDLWNDLTASGQDPLPAPVTQLHSSPASTWTLSEKSWLDACLDFNESAAEQVLNQAFALYPLETVCVEILQRGLNEIGEMWYHCQSHRPARAFHLGPGPAPPGRAHRCRAPPTRPQTILIGCTNQRTAHVHPFALSTVTLRRRGFRGYLLGRECAHQRFNETLQTVKPHLVILSAQLLQTARWAAGNSRAPTGQRSAAWHTLVASSTCCLSCASASLRTS